MFRIELPEIFTGKDGRDFAQWAKRLKVAAEVDPSTESRLHVLLPSRLAGSAFTVWENLPSSTKASFAESERALSGVFGRKNDIAAFQSCITARTRQDDEPLEVYAAAITSLVQEAFPEYGEKAQEGEMVRRFVAGLSNFLQIRIDELGVSTFKEALDFALQIERTRLGHAQVPNPDTFVKATRDDLIRQLVNRLERVDKRFDRLETELSHRRSKDDDVDRLKSQFSNHNLHHSRSPFARQRSQSPQHRYSERYEQRSTQRYHSPSRCYESSSTKRYRSPSPQPRHTLRHDQYRSSSPSHSYPFNRPQQDGRAPYQDLLSRHPDSHQESQLPRPSSTQSCHVCTLNATSYSSVGTQTMSELESEVPQSPSSPPNCLQGLEPKLLHHHKLDKDLEDIRHMVTNNTKPTVKEIRRSQPGKRRLLWQFSRLSIHNDILYRTKMDEKQSVKLYQAIVPESLVQEVLKLLHGHPTLGHFSAERTLERAKTSYFWPYMHRDVLDFCETCRACEMIRSPNPGYHAPSRTDSSRTESCHPPPTTQPPTTPTNRTRTESCHPPPTTPVKSASRND